MKRIRPPVFTAMRVIHLLCGERPFTRTWSRWLNFLDSCPSRDALALRVAFEQFAQPSAAEGFVIHYEGADFHIQFGSQRHSVEKYPGEAEWKSLLASRLWADRSAPGELASRKVAAGALACYLI